MRIGLNLLFLLPGEVGGVETYAVRLAQALARAESDHEYVVFANDVLRKTEALSWHRGPVVWCPLSGRSRLLRYAWEQLVLPAQSVRQRLDVLHSLAYVGPARGPTRKVLTIHDLNFRRLASYIPRGRRWALKRFSMAAARGSSAVVTVSEFSKREIVSEMGLPADKVHVTLEGPGWADDTKLLERGALPMALPERYFCVFGGGGSAHKNVDIVLRCAATVRRESGLPIVVIGKLPLASQTQVSQHSAGDVVPLGYLTCQVAMTVLRESCGLVVPSLYEGFGLPVVEAQWLGVPVVCSNAGSLPEVAGEAALLFDPRSAEQLTEALLNLARSQDLRARLRSLGRANATRFSWDNTARETLKIYDAIVPRRFESAR